MEITLWAVCTPHEPQEGDRAPIAPQGIIQPSNSVSVTSQMGRSIEPLIWGEDLELHF